jgi:hypothetical protein
LDRKSLSACALQAAQASTGFLSVLNEAGISFLQAAVHGFAQGTLSLMQGGGTFEQAFVSGALGSVGASAFSAVAGNFASSGVGMVLSGAVLGGVGAELSGGNFWQGALIGGVVAGLNHVTHRMDGPKQKTQQQQKNPWDLNGDGRISLNEANNWYRDGKGQAITLDASKIDLDFVDTSKWVKGKTYGIQTLTKSSEGRVLGQITVKYLGNNQVSIFSDTYNFEQHGGYFDHTFRNVANSIGRWVAGEGAVYQINFKGINTISPPKAQPTRIYP